MSMSSRTPQCHFFKRGICRYGNFCRYRHDLPSANSTTNTECRYVSNENKEEITEGKTCGICFEEVISKKKGTNTFGILPNCKHCFCFPCIRMWRSSVHFEEEVTKSCPECRVNSNYVYKNSSWIDDEDKEEFIAARNRKLANINCRFYRGGRGYCKLGSNCLYRHANKNIRNQREQSNSSEDEEDSCSRIIRQMLFEVRLLAEENYLFDDSDSDDEAFYYIDGISH